MGNYKIKSTIFFVLLIITSQIAVSEFVNGSIEPINHELTTNSLVVLDTFPVDLDLLFWEDDLAIRAHYLNMIGNSSFGWMVTPWGGHYVSNHIEGADKFYLYAYRHIEVYAPADGSFMEAGGLVILNGTIDNFHGNDVITDVRLSMDIGEDCALVIDHLDLLKSINDEINNTNSYDFVEGEFIGYTPGDYALDFTYYQGKGFRSICPYNALSVSLQTQFANYFDMQYQRAKICGIFPESNIENDYNIGINNTAWGVWEYKNSKYGSTINQTEDWGEYEPSVIAFMQRNFTNPETFYRNPINTIYNLTEDIVGLVTDNHAGKDIGDYNSIGQCLIKQESGYELEGIFEFRTYGYSDWGSSNTTIYARYEVIENETNFGFDDELIIEYYDNLISAEAGFTADNFSYIRHIPQWDSYIEPAEETPTPTIVSGYSRFLGQTILIVSFVVLICVQKKKKIE
ncbi:MAG: hypothetical protein GPJ52_14770 [Candidatus Heimdallarchaeota archaeon]|nr:hypothetical protein [Candidatus Heimdallarchaeota archaeon]